MVTAAAPWECCKGQRMRCSQGLTVCTCPEEESPWASPQVPFWNQLLRPHLVLTGSGSWETIPGTEVCVQKGAWGVRSGLSPVRVREAGLDRGWGTVKSCSKRPSRSLESPGLGWPLSCCPPRLGAPSLTGLCWAVTG